MARKELLVTIAADGRDQGKQFKLTEMPALQAERWATRAFLAMARSGMEIPDDFASMGMAGFAAFGLRALGGITFDEALPLLDEMFKCVEIIPPSGVARKLLDAGTPGDDIEEVATRLQLRRAVFELHVNFSTPADPPK